MEESLKKKAIVRKVVHVTMTADGNITKHELTPEELEKWKKDNGYSTESQNKPNT